MTNILLSTAEAMSFSERMTYGLQVFVVGLVTVFVVLTILWFALIIFRIFAYDIPQKKAKKVAEVNVTVEDVVAEDNATEVEDVVEYVEDDTQLIAVITAAVAAYSAQSGSTLPFRVVSYKRVSGANGWNSK